LVTHLRARRRESTVCRSRELLAAVVASEEALISHMGECPLCRHGKYDVCLVHTDLVVSNAEAILESKFYLDVTDPDDCASVATVSEVGGQAVL
jgi:hypothetical protein